QDALAATPPPKVTAQLRNLQLYPVSVRCFRALIASAILLDSLKKNDAARVSKRSCKAVIPVMCSAAQSIHLSPATCLVQRLRVPLLPVCLCGRARSLSKLCPGASSRHGSASRAVADSRECKRQQEQSCPRPERWRSCRTRPPKSHKRPWKSPTSVPAFGHRFA